MSNMVVVISDLHFEEEQSDIIAGLEADGTVELRRNVPASMFEGLISDVVDLARDRKVEKIDFVLAGDVFDLHRTQLWFTPDCPADVRPFVDNGVVAQGSPIEKKVLAILDAIVSEAPVTRSLEAFQRLARGMMLDDAGQIVPIGIPVTMHYLPGNHDRLANATPAIRDKVRSLLKLGDSGDFAHRFEFTDPNVFIRHGHEYDPVNFGSKLRGRRIERDIRRELYDRATLGDFITVQVASRLPNLFRTRYGTEIARDPVLRTVYLRLLEFDDLRPQSLIVSFILDIWPPRELAEQYRTRHDDWRVLMWQKVEPVIRDLVADVIANLKVHPHVRSLLPWYVRLLLPLVGLWRRPIPLVVMDGVAWALSKFDSGSQPYRAASREEALDETADFVAAGHTHAPQVAHLFTGKGGRKKYFVDTGTWRNAVLGSFRRSYFGRVNATTYVAFFGPAGDKVERSFEFVTGMNQNWPVNDSER
jgi:UDP-2,3-diacylglucosamine pyrophosphatase LpxH